MSDISVCAACLVTDVRMYSISAARLLEPYRILAGIQDWEGLPQAVCYECAALVRKAEAFRERCQRAYVLLRDMYIDHDQITLEAVHRIDRRTKKLMSPHTISAISTTSFECKQKGDRANRHKPRGKRKKREKSRPEHKEEIFFEIDKDEVASVKSEELSWELPVVTGGDSDDEPLKRRADSDAGLAPVKTESEEVRCGYIEEVMSKEEQLECVRSRQYMEGYRNGRYKCVECFKSYPRRDRYINHMLLHQPSSGDYECDVCMIRLGTRDALREHVKKNHSKKYTCTVCRHVSFNQNTAAMHAKGHKTVEARNTTSLNKLQATAVKLSKEEQARVFAERGERREYAEARYRCTLCYHVSARREGLDRHMRKHDPNISGAVECPICRLRFRSRQALTQHRVRSHMRRYACDMCGHASYSLKEAKSHHQWHAGGCKPAKAPKVKREVQEQVGELRETMSIEGLTQVEQRLQFMETRNSDAPFKCEVCLKGHYEAKAFRNHQLKHEPVSGKFQCDICKYRYKTRYHIQRHIVYFHKSRYRCKLCSLLFYNRMAATKHHLYHKGKVYECKHCGLRSNILSTHLTHLRLKHPSEHVCAACGEAFVSRLGLQQHHRISHTVSDGTRGAEEEGGPHCVECDIRFASTQAYTRHLLLSPKHLHQRSTISNGCQTCGESFGTEQQLKEHRRAEHPPRFQRARAYNPLGKRPRPCAQCGEMMSNARDYWTHFRREHPGDTYPLEVPMSHICEHCGKGFRCNALLAIHRHVHTGTRNYKCHLCPKSFFGPLNLRNHLVSHSERRPHACSLCGKAFKFKSALERHMRTHTGAKPYECEICGKGFSTSSSGRLHMRAVHHKEPAPHARAGKAGARRLAVEGVWPAQ